MNVLAALGGGVAGACALTLLHETGRHLLPDAPRMDVLGMRAIGQTLEQVGADVPADGPLHDLALGGELLANGLYYSLVGAGTPAGALGRGAVLGLLAGIGAVALPGPMGLGSEPSNRTTATQALTVAWYLVGGIAAAATYRVLAGPTEARNQSLTSSNL